MLGNSTQPSSDEGWRDFRIGQQLNFSRAELFSSMRYSVGVFPAGLLWNCAAPPPQDERVSLSPYLRRPRNVRKRVHPSMFRIRSTRFLSRLQEWNFRDCFGFAAERPRAVDRI